MEIRVFLLLMLYFYYKLNTMKMKTRFYLFSAVVLFSLLGFGFSNFEPDNKPIKLSNSDEYVADWKKVDSLSNKGLPKSALKIVNAIYIDAKNKNNSNQIIKSFIYKMKFKNAVEESGFENSIYDLQKEILVAKYPSKNIMQSMLAEMYWMYYQANRWKFSKRTQTIGYSSNDIKTWDLNTLADHAIKNYKLSLQNADSLKRTPISYFSVLINKGENTENLRTTLYDFLAQRAIDFFKNKEIALSRPTDSFQLKENFYFADASIFANTKIESLDTLSLQFYGIKILQNITKFRLLDKNIDAFVDVELQRLQFVYSNSTNPNKDRLYKIAIENLLKKYGNKPFSTNISFELGSYYNNLGSKYYYADTATYKYKKYELLAYKIFDNAIKKYPNTIGAKKGKYILNQMMKKSLSFEIEKVIIPNNNFVSFVKYKNIETVYTKLLKLDFNEYKKLSNNYYGEDLYNKLLQNSEVVKTNYFTLVSDKDFNAHSTEFIFNKLNTGFYLLVMSDNSEFNTKESLLSYKTFTVSNLSYISSNNKNMVEFYILNRTTGEPINEAKIDIFTQKYDYHQRKYIRKKISTKNSNKLGYLSINNAGNNSFYIDIYYKDDFLTSNNSFYAYDYGYKEKPHIKNHIFTDRAIYRPGQTVYFKGIAIKYEGDKRKIVTNKTELVNFYDVNYQMVSALKLKTNEFGTFNGSFEIPLGILNGQMQIQTPDGSVYFNVEEYKRPKFETSILPFKGNYQLYDSVAIQGKALSYSGANITDAQVKYRVIRSPKWRYWWWNRTEPTVEIANGTTTTNDKGIYTINFKALPDLKYKQSEGISFNYTIYVDVIDNNGETQSTSSNINIGYVDLNISANIPSAIAKENTDTFKISTTNLNGEFVSAKGNIKIFKLKSLKRAKQKRLWSEPDTYIYNKTQWEQKIPDIEYQTQNVMNLQTEKQVFSSNFDTEKDKILLLPNLIKWQTGYYKLIASSKDAFGNDVDNIQYFTLFSDKSTEMPYPQISWYKPLKVNCEPGDTAKLLIGSSKKVKVIYELERKNTSQKHFIEINNEQKLISIPIAEEDRGNITVYFSYVYNNRVYFYTQTIVVPNSNKELDISFQTFRNKLLPGTKEKWLMTIKNKNGDAVMSELMAVLYDKSLDKFATNTWFLNIWDTRYNDKSWQTDMFGSQSSQLIYNTNKQYVAYPNIRYDTFNWFGFNYYANNYYKFSNGLTRSAGGKMLEETVMAETTEDERNYDAVPAEKSKKAVTKGVAHIGELKKAEAGSTDKKLSQIKARTNFNETAFFYPELRTNEKGELVVEFTIPESLTTWRMKGLATTKDLKIGYVENELITQKDLMVMPNPPRFFREGDIIKFPLKISNVSKKELKVNYNIEFFDAITNKRLNILDNVKNNAVTITKGGNSSVYATITIPDNIDAIKYRVVAKAGKFSDAEENVIPVLNNRMLVTESMPLPIRGNTSKTFTFTKLKNNKSKTFKNYKYTLEFTSNPAWYAVQSLPYLMEYPYECAEQTFSRFYANSIASHIANSSPKIKAVFNSWKNAPKSEALLSNLEKNKELKALMLEETPWVLDGKNESERKARIGLLFNLNKMSYEQNKALRKLQNMQSPNGGWPWFKGMPDNRYITQYIISGLGHLTHLGVKNIRNDYKTWQMTLKAINYLDNRILDDYTTLVKNYTKSEIENQHISSTQIQYLYARSFFNDVEIPQKISDAYNYYIKQAKRYWHSENKYSQAMIALALYRDGGAKTGIHIEQEIVKSLKENSIIDKEMGMYWKANTAGYYWYQAPIETQALMIEAFDEVANDQNAVEELKIWLLKQKQTQNWGTTKATSEAIYAMLLKGSNLLASDKLVEIKLGNNNIDPRIIDGVNIEAGTGYFKTSWNGNEITPEMGKITVSKKDDGVAWGAVYWQYFEQLDKITKHKTPLYLEKKLFVEKLTKSGKIIEPITKNKLKVGDKVIVRIELRVDRNMEYVHMKDMRASGFEPINVISQYKYQDGLGYYETTKDASTNFFMDYLRKGTYVFEYPLRVSHSGDFSNGITTIQCMYAPEFTSHSEGVRVDVE